MLGTRRGARAPRKEPAGPRLVPFSNVPAIIQCAPRPARAPSPREAHACAASLRAHASQTKLGAFSCAAADEDSDSCGAQQAWELLQGTLHKHCSPLRNVRLSCECDSSVLSTQVCGGGGVPPRAQRPRPRPPPPPERRCPPPRRGCSAA